MQDSNLFSRANFEDTVLQFSCNNVKAGQTGKAFSGFTTNQVFCVQEVSWKYSVETTDDSYGWPKSPAKVTILGITENRVESPLRVSPPKLLTDSLQVEVQNPSSLAITVHFTVKGILVTTRNNGAISTTEILGYALLDNNQRGLLALSGPSGHRQLGDSSSPFQQLENQIPKSLPLKQPPALADEQSLNSLMIGDLVTYQPEQPEFALKLEQIRDLAKYLIGKKWFR